MDRVYADPATGTVVAAARRGGVLVSTDDGRTFAAPAAPSALAPPSPAAPLTAAPPVVAAAVSRGQPRALLVATAAADPALGGAAATALWRSDDGGASFTPAGSVPAPATALAYDAWSAQVVWLAAASSPGAGLWQSTDSGTTWRRVLDGPAYAVDSARRAAASLVAVARDDGLWRTGDLGDTWSRAPSARLHAARIDSGGPAALALTTAAPVRFDAAGRPAVRHADGLPGCAPHDLAADAALPTTFVLGCAGRWYATVSDATVTSVDGGPAEGGVPVTGRTLLPLTRLRELHLPAADGTSSGSLGFDGHALYYAGEFAPPQGSRTPIDVVHLMSPRDGRDLGSVDPGVPAKFLTYDSRHDRMYVDDGHAMWVLGLARGRRRLAFPSSYGYQDSYDPLTRTFLGVQEGSAEQAMLFIGQDGRIAGQCPLGPAIDASLTTTPYPSAIVAAADGAYVLLEDDSTVIRIGRDCALRATYLTRKVSESARENDEVACDPMTFAPRTALWIRDSGVDTVTAYDLPGGYCPFVSTLSLSAPRTVAAGAAARICATVRGAARAEPIAGQAVSLDAGGVVLAAPPTGRDGRTCATAVLPARTRRTATVRARYAGTAQWTPAAASAAVTVIPAPLPHRAAPGVAPVAGAAAPVGLAAGAAAPPGPNPPPEPLHLPQHQPQPQQQPGQQPGTQAGFAPDDENAPQLALADSPEGEETYAMSRRADPSPAVVLLGAALVTATAAWALRRGTNGEPARAGTGSRRPYDPRRGHAAGRGR